MITATKPFVPDIKLYDEKIHQMFNNVWFTNFGPMVNELEEELQDYFGSKYFLLVTNGTISLQLAIKALDLKGEIITTPFSYIATTSAIVWENCKPVYADIDPKTFNIDPKNIEKLITPNTSAIFATQVYGYPCDFDSINSIANKYNLKVIYDSAHVFGTEIKGESIFNQGDISSISFHATKLFHTIEGGGIFCKNEEIYNKLKLLRNFGHTSPSSFGGLGINAKMNEACAAMGLCNLNYIDTILDRRKEQWLFYFNLLKFSKLKLAEFDRTSVDYNYAYFPVVVESEELLLKIMDSLQKNDIHIRRYFYPSLNTLDYVEYVSCPISEDISKRVFCLPLYHELDTKDQERICKLISALC